jgi:group I intron endonuclease
MYYICSMKKVVYIYSLKDPRDYQIKYIGKTVDIDRRRKEHSQIHRNKKSRKNSWVAHLVKNGMQPIMEILEECEKSKWVEREKYWIRYYKELGFDLKNMTLGGESNDGYVFTIEDRLKQSESQKLRHKTTPFSIETREKLSKKAKQTLNGLDNLKLGSKKSQIPIIQKTKDGEIIKKWESLQQAADELGIERSNISHCLRGRIKTSGGFKWEYQTSFEKHKSVKPEAHLSLANG